jgi:hypothetical protein
MGRPRGTSSAAEHLSSDPSDASLSVSPSAKTLGRKEGREADEGTIRPPSSVLCPPISDIVKRKRIRYPEYG